MYLQSLPAFLFEDYHCSGSKQYLPMNRLHVHKQGQALWLNSSIFYPQDLWEEVFETFGSCSKNQMMMLMMASCPSFYKVSKIRRQLLRPFPHCRIGNVHLRCRDISFL